MRLPSICISTQARLVVVLLSFLLIGGILPRVAVGQSGCVNDLLDIYVAELSLDDVSADRSYTLCHDSVFSVGSFDDNGAIQNGSPPLLLRSNARVQCGADGSSSNNCVIDGTGQTGILLAPSQLGLEETTVENVVIQGITIDQFVTPDALQVPVLVGADGGDITFLDCVYSNNLAQPFFFLDQYYFVESQQSQRRLQLQLNFTETDLKDAAAYRSSYGGRALYQRFQLSMLKEGKAEVQHYRDQEEPHSHRHRQLQLQSGALTLTFDSCQFLSNTNLQVPYTSHGLTMLRFRGAEFPDIGVDVVGTLDANIVNCIFQDNLNTFDSDDNVTVRSWIDFYSTGTLRLENNCFINSPLSATPQSNYVLTQANSTVVSTNNFIDPAQDLSCPFVAERAADDSFLQCNSDALADATTCLATPVTAAPASPASTPTGAPVMVGATAPPVTPSPTGGGGGTTPTTVPTTPPPSSASARRVPVASAVVGLGVSFLWTIFA